MKTSTPTPAQRKSYLDHIAQCTFALGAVSSLCKNGRSDLDVDAHSLGDVLDLIYQGILDSMEKLEDLDRTTARARGEVGGPGGGVRMTVPKGKR
jgi:hypothetical protein